MLIKPQSNSLVYLMLVTMLTISMTGLPLIRYVAYSIPILALALWLFIGKLEIHINRNAVPFLFLIVVSLLYIDVNDFNGLKRLWFLLTYTVPFILFDLSNCKFSVEKLNLLFIVLLVITTFWLSPRGLSAGDIEFSIRESRSSFESSLSFPLGLFAVYFAIKRKFIWTAVNVALAIIALKRIVVGAILLCVLMMFLPKSLTNRLTNPIVVAASIGTALILAIEFAMGAFDPIILELTGQSPNAFTRGRQNLWREVLVQMQFSYQNYILLGAGLGESISILKDSYQVDRILLHNDFLMIFLEHGFLAMLIFAYTLNNQKSTSERLLALYLSILFITDNVLIYQHVMIPYLLLIAQLRSEASKPSVHAHRLDRTRTRIRQLAKQFVSVEPTKPEDNGKPSIQRYPATDA